MISSPKNALLNAVKTIARTSAYQDRWEVASRYYRRFWPNGSKRHMVSVVSMLLEVGTRSVALPVSKMGGKTDVSTLVGENSLRRLVDNGNEVS